MKRRLSCRCGIRLVPDELMCLCSRGAGRENVAEMWCGEILCFDEW